MYSKTPNIFSFASHYRYELLSPKDLEELKGKTLYLLEEVGVHFPSNKALKIFLSSLSSLILCEIPSFTRESSTMINNN